MKNNIQKIYLVVSALLFIVCCVAFVVLYGAINSNNQKAEASLITFQTEAKRRDDIRSLDRSLQEVADDRTQLETHFAQSSDVVPFLDTIEQLGPTAGADAQVDSVNTGDNNTGLIVGLKATGSFESLYKFLTLLENSPYELNFLSMDIHQTSGTASWEADFKIQLLSFIQ